HELDGPIITLRNDQRAIMIAPGILDDDRRRILLGPLNRLVHECAQGLVAVREDPSIEPNVQAIDRSSNPEPTAQKPEHPTNVIDIEVRSDHSANSKAVICQKALQHALIAHIEDNCAV